MYHRITCFLPIFLLLITFGTNLCAKEENQIATCVIEDRPCIIKQMTKDTELINNTSWRDQTYREIAKSHAFDGNFSLALNIIPKIQTPDTKAMAIRGIGMAIAQQEHNQDEFDSMFMSLRKQAESISHPPSYAIALTYIAMAQAFAGDDEGAWKTASDMNNDALRNKAYGETAEIQAENDRFTAAKKSIEKINSLSFRNKAYSTISKILSDNSEFKDAYIAVNMITNLYKKTQAMQYMLDKQNPRDIKH